MRGSSTVALRNSSRASCRAPCQARDTELLLPTRAHTGGGAGGADFDRRRGINLEVSGAFGGRSEVEQVGCRVRRQLHRHPQSAHRRCVRCPPAARNAVTLRRGRRGEQVGFARVS